MKKIFLFIASAVCAFILLTSCSRYEKGDLQFYVVRRSVISDSMSISEKVKTARAEGRLAFDGGDIDGYNWQTHTVFLKEDSAASVGVVTKESGGSAIFKTDDSYVFVLLLKNKLIYVGGFKNGVKNPDVPLQPCIEDSGRYSFKITYDGKYANTDDPRSDSRMYKFLSKQGLLSSKTE